MSAISGVGDPSLQGATLTPQQQAEEALLGGSPSGLLPGATPQQQADAALVDLSDASTAAGNLGAALSGGPASLSEAGALVDQLTAEVTAQGAGAANAFKLLSATAAYSLTKP